MPGGKYGSKFTEAGDYRIQLSIPQIGFQRIPCKMKIHLWNFMKLLMLIGNQIVEFEVSMSKTKITMI